MLSSTLLSARAKAIKLVLFDVDGVMTDGGVYIGPEGQIFKRFDVHDGQGIVLLHQAGLRSGLFSGSPAPAAYHRGQNLGMHIIKLGCVDKKTSFQSLLKEEGLQASEVAFMGDDLVDLPVLKQVALAVAPQNARSEVKNTAHYICNNTGGHGAVREFCEWLLKQRKYSYLKKYF